MRTDALIGALAADAGVKPRRFSRVYALALAVGAVLAAAVFLMMLRPRADFAEALTTARYALKLSAAIALAVTASFALSRLARPGAPAAAALLAILVAPIAVATGAVAELAVTPSSDWAPLLIGANPMTCMTHIPIIAGAPLAAFLLALRDGAPSSPVGAGAVAGLAAGGLAAAIYALFCDQDSPLFVATWYVLGVLIVTAIGAALGSRLLRW